VTVTSPWDERSLSTSSRDSVTLCLCSKGLLTKDPEADGEVTPLKLKRDRGVIRSKD